MRNRKRLGPIALAFVTQAFAVALPVAAHAVNTCNGAFEIAYATVPGKDFPLPGDTLKVRLTLGAGSIQGGTQLTVNRVRFDLDCNDNNPIGLPCPDDGAVVEYEGDTTIVASTTGCGNVGFTSNVGNSPSAATNEVVFTPSSPIVIPANTPPAAANCELAFDVKILTRSNDNTPDLITELSGFSQGNGDASCNNGLPAGNQVSGSLPLCQVCDDGNGCTTDMCNQTTNMCEFSPPRVCTEGDPGTDGNLCTPPLCVSSTGNCGDGPPTVCADPLCQQCDPADGQCKEIDPPPPSCGLDHFQCYETHRQPINEENVSLVDQFGASTVTVKENRRVCAPASTNGGDPTAPADPEHLTFFTLKQTSPRFTKVRGVTVTNQFGSLVVDVVKPDRLLVPTAKSLTAAPGPLTTPIDHYKCYRVRGRFRESGISVQDQFGTITVDIKKPLQLCAPADKNGEGIVNPVTHLLCYQVRLTSGTTLHAQPSRIFTLNQFGADAYPIFGPRELCVPSRWTLP